MARNGVAGEDVAAGKSEFGGEPELAAEPYASHATHCPAGCPVTVR